MSSCRIVAALLLLAALQARAQGPDTATPATSPPSGGNTAEPVGANALDDTSPMPHCWHGCKCSIQGAAPEWLGSGQSRLDALVSHLSRKHPPLSPPAARTDAGTPAATTAKTAESYGDVSPSPEKNASGASEAEAQLYLIKEWRQSELNIADSLHHAVLVRIARVFDSAQRATVLPDDRLRIEHELDGINSNNQMMWLERRVDIYRQADSAIRALGATAH